MESSAFDVGTEHDDTDPFGANGMGDFQQDDPLADAEPPIVDKEGNPVQASSSDAATQVASSAQMTEGAPPIPDGETQVAEPIPGQTDLEEALAEEDPSSAPTDGAQTASSAEPTKSDTSASAESGEADPTGAAESGSPASPDASAPAPTEPSGDPATATEPKKGKRGEPRDYILLSATGPGTWEQVTWFEDKKGNIVTAGTTGAKKQTIARVRSLGEALRIGFVALGSPKDGVTLVAVAANFWQPKQVAPKPVVPARTQLSIT